MVPFSASELLYFKKEDVRAEIVSKCHDSLVSVIDIEGFVDLLDEPLFTDSLSSAGAVKLRTFEKAGKRGKKDVVRIFGAASYDKQSLKKFLKDEPEIVQRQHTEIVKRLNLLDFDSSGSFSIWRSAGEEFFELIGHFIKKSLQSQGYIPIRLPSPSTLAFLAEQEEEGLHFDLLCERAKLVKQNGLDRSFELATFYDHSLTDFSCGLLKTVESNFILSYSFCKEKQLFEECISSLLFLSKMLKILGFEFDVVVTLRKVKPSALGNRERICADTLKKAVSALEGVSIVEKAHSTFKGAKVEFRVSDALGRNWSTSFMLRDILVPAIVMTLTQTCSPQMNGNWL
jgi:threonyl-tRNA synthetase